MARWIANSAMRSSGEMMDCMKHLLFEIGANWPIDILIFFVFRPYMLNSPNRMVDEKIVCKKIVTAKTRCN